MKKLAVHEGTVLVPEPMFNAMVAVVEAAQDEARTRDDMLGEVPIGAWGERHSALMTAWITAGATNDTALAVLNELVRAG